MGKKLGLAANLYLLPTGPRATWSATATNGVYSGAAPTGLVIVGGTKDVSIDLEKQSVDASDRDNLGWTGSVGALRKGPVSFKLNYNMADPGQAALFACFINSGTFVGVAVLDGLAATSGTQGFWADVEVMKFSVSQNLNGMQEVDVMLEPSALTSVPPQWVKVS